MSRHNASRWLNSRTSPPPPRQREQKAGSIQRLETHSQAPFYSKYQFYIENTFISFLYKQVGVQVWLRLYCWLYVGTYCDFSNAYREYTCTCCMQTWLQGACVSFVVWTWHSVYTIPSFRVTAPRRSDPPFLITQKTFDFHAVYKCISGSLEFFDDFDVLVFLNGGDWIGKGLGQLGNCETGTSFKIK